MTRPTPLRIFVLGLALLTTASFPGCTHLGGGGTASTPGLRSPESGSSGRIGTSVVALEFLYSFENEAKAIYYPMEGLAGCTYSPEGTLIVCDEKRGKVYGLDNTTFKWYEFDTPPSPLYRPVDVQVDGFKVLTLDMMGNTINRFDLSGAWQDEILKISHLDPGYSKQSSAFAVDRDGRMIIADTSSQQLLMLDTFLSVTMRVGGGGMGDDQFNDPSGIVFLPDGSFVVSDRGNRRLALYGRLGFFETVIGGEYELNNPFVAPQGMECDRFGNLFVADPGSGKIHVLDRRLRHSFSAGDEFTLAGTPMGPVAVAVGPDDQLAVTDRIRSAILVYRIIYE